MTNQFTIPRLLDTLTEQSPGKQTNSADWYRDNFPHTQVKSIKEHIKCNQYFIDTTTQVSTGPSGASTPSGPASTSDSNIGKVTPSSNQYNPTVKQITFKMNVGNSDANDQGDGTKVLNNLNFQTQCQDIPMADDTMEDGEEYEIDPVRGWPATRRPTRPADSSSGTDRWTESIWPSPKEHSCRPWKPVPSWEGSCC